MFSKVLRSNDLPKIRNFYKKKKIILAHGTFDFFHYGHFKHLEISKKNSDILVVSITSAFFVKKGPNRPIYSDKQRIEFLSGLSFVDHIYLEKSESGINVIKKLKPNYYSKGIEYQNKTNDFTNKISLEEKEVKRNGGKIFYSNQYLLSASKLINNFRFIEQNKNFAFLNEIKKKYNFNFFYKKFELIKNKKVLVIGDLILDEYIFTIGLAKSPKEELVSVKEENRTMYLGGILATAKHISNFVNKPTLLTVLGNDSKQNQFIKNDIKKTCKLAIFKDLYRKNTTKSRFIDESKKKLFQSNKVYFENINNKLEKKIINYLNKNLHKFDLVIVNDFGHGLLTEKIRRIIELKSKNLTLNVQTNSANFGYSFYYKYKKCDYLTLDEPEARLSTGERFLTIENVVKKILKNVKSKIVAVTHGSNETRIFKEKKNFFVPALSKNVVDTLGAGDAFFAISSIYSLIDKDPRNIAFVGNLSGALQIQYLGHEKTIDRDNFFSYLKSFLS